MQEKFKLFIKKEVLYYVLTFIVLALIFHIDLLSDPLSRFELMNAKENYSHPFFYALIVYGSMFILRKFIDII